jgi:hypothetical protein
MITNCIYLKTLVTDIIMMSVTKVLKIYKRLMLLRLLTLNTQSAGKHERLLLRRLIRLPLRLLPRRVRFQCLCVALNDTRDNVVVTTLGDQLSLIQTAAAAIMARPTKTGKPRTAAVNQGEMLQFLGIAGRKKANKNKAKKKKKGQSHGNISVSTWW